MDAPDARGSVEQSGATQAIRSLTTSTSPGESTASGVTMRPRMITRSVARPAFTVASPITAGRGTSAHPAGGSDWTCWPASVPASVPASRGFFPGGGAQAKAKSAMTTGNRIGETHLYYDFGLTRASAGKAACAGQFGEVLSHATRP